jgi:SAM-dependent methyltransferase
MKRLTDVNYWEQNWWTRQRPSRLRLYRDFDLETIRLLRNMAGPESARVLEVGAGGSRVLPYLRHTFRYEVMGTDFSLGGCRLLRANLALLGEEGSVVCGDLFASSLREEIFDLAYSSGLIEHFEDTRVLVAEHVRFLKPGGRLVLIVPNLRELQGRILKRLAPPRWARHHVFGPEELAEVVSSLGLKEVRYGYLGSFFVNVGRTDDWLGVRRWPVWLQFLVSGSVRVVNGLISFLFRHSPLRPHSRALSTSFDAAGVKPRT